MEWHTTQEELPEVGEQVIGWYWGYAYDCWTAEEAVLHKDGLWLGDEGTLIMPVPDYWSRGKVPPPPKDANEC